MVSGRHPHAHTIGVTVSSHTHGGVTSGTASTDATTPSATATCSKEKG
ncbi:MAG: hypothetical protein NC827_05965 [Candidatus Omnitrophica bacterium]|nr:hypothetical protein [Candidatus Omnitrophota bacterium]